MKRVQLVDLLNDLEKEEEINKRIKEHLKNINDVPLPYYSPERNHQMSSGGSSSIIVINSTTTFAHGWGRKK